MAWFAIFGAQRCDARLRQQRSRLLRVAYSWCHSRALADDLVQETLTRAMEKCHQLRDIDQLEPWLFTILTNCWRDYLRRLRPTDNLDELEETLFELDASPETSSQQEQIVDRVQKAVARLPIGQREVLTLVDLEEFSYAEVSAILTIPIGTVMSRLCRARQSLKQDLLDFDLNMSTETKRLRRVK